MDWLRKRVATRLGTRKDDRRNQRSHVEARWQHWYQSRLGVPTPRDEYAKAWSIAVGPHGEEDLVNTTLGQLMERNVLEVFGERDSARRKSVIDELYTENCTFFEADDQVIGRDALNAKVQR